MYQLRRCTMKRLITSPRASSPRLNLETIQALRLHPQATPSPRAYSEAVDKNFDSRKAAIADRHRLDSQTTENTGTGTDASVAERADVSFDPTKSLDPEHARQRAGQGESNINPLEVSSANKDVSETSREAETGRDTVSVRKETTSYFSKTLKAGHGEAGEFKGFDRRKEGQTPTYVKPGSR